MIEESQTTNAEEGRKMEIKNKRYIYRKVE